MVVTDLSSSRWPELPSVLDAASLSEAAVTLVSSVRERPDLPARLAKMALVLRSKHQDSDARALARAARALDDADYRLRIMTEWCVREQAPTWHFDIIADEVRNETYGRALEAVVKPGMTVLEIGTGTGLLSMLAARAGAAHVYTVEREPDVARAAREIIARNDMADRITVIDKDAHELRLGEDLPRRADVFVAELVDDSLLGEDVLGLTRLARERFLVDDAILLPSEVSAIGCVVAADEQHHKRYRMADVMGFDLTPFNRFSPVRSSWYDMTQGRDVVPLSEPTTLLHLDLTRDVPKEASTAVSLTITRPGKAEGVMRWLRLDFGHGIVYEVRPPKRSCWTPLVHHLRAPLDLAPGDAVEVEVSYRGVNLFLVPKVVGLNT